MYLTHQQAALLMQQALDAVPHEICGLLAGDNGIVERILPVANVAADPLKFFEMDHAGLVRAMFAIERAGLSLIGIYHSHPQGDPIPSPADIAQARYPDVAHVIIGVKQNSLAAWRINRASVQVEPLHIGVKPHESQRGLSSAQKTAVVVSAILAFLLAIGISLMLLPPAPPLP
jgi:desampylase